MLWSADAAAARQWGSHPTEPESRNRMPVAAARIATDATSHVLGVFVSIVLAKERKAPAKCPSCSSVRLTRRRG
jgi:hypothetical protein